MHLQKKLHGIKAHTLREENNSVHILRKLGFIFQGEIELMGEGPLWYWLLLKEMYLLLSPLESSIPGMETQWSQIILLFFHPLIKFNTFSSISIGNCLLIVIRTGHFNIYVKRWPAIME